MSDLSYSGMLRALCVDYSSHNISQQEYRNKRKQILDSIDAEFNGVQNSSPPTSEDSLLMRTISFFKNKDNI